MKIGYFGDGKWAHIALERIAATPQFEIVYIVARFDNPDPVLRKYANQLNVPFLTYHNVNDSKFLDSIKQFNPDINVSMSFNQILKADIIQSAPKGFINCHAGALPFYRGRNILNWALINGERNFGVTVHYVDEGIDTGDIIIQQFEEITESDDYGSVLQKAFNLSADTLHKALIMVEQGHVNIINQNSVHPVGFYCGRRKNGDEWIDWNWSTERINNFIRGITLPGPGARTLFQDNEIVILKSHITPNSPKYIGTPGEVIGRDELGILVKTGDSTINVTLMGIVNEEGEIVEKQIPAFSIGVRLDSKLNARLRDLEKRIVELESLIKEKN